MHYLGNTWLMYVLLMYVCMYYLQSIPWFSVLSSISNLLNNNTNNMHKQLDSIF